jgi:hypothetical protein
MRSAIVQTLSPEERRQAHAALALALTISRTVVPGTGRREPGYR